MSPSPTRTRLIANLARDQGDDALGQLEQAFELAHAVEPIRDQLRRAGVKDWKQAHRAGTLTDEQARQLEAADIAARKVIAVDDFAPGEFVRHAN